MADAPLDHTTVDSPTVDGTTLTRGTLLWLTLLVEGGLGVSACVSGWLLDVPTWEKLDANLVEIGWGCAATLPMLVVFWVCTRWPVGPLRKIAQFMDDVIRPVFRQCGWIDLLVISALAGLGEELFFRGFLQTYLSVQFGPLAGLLLASFLFGLFHPITTAYVVLAALLGVFLGVVTQATDNLLPAVIAHGLYDFIALVVLTQSKDEVPS